MTINNKTAEDIVAKIRMRDRATLTSIYKDAYPMVENYILKNSGSKTDAQDVFQDGMYLLIKKAGKADFVLTAKVSTFLFSISRNLWLKQLTKQKIDITELKREQEQEVELNNLEVADNDFGNLKRVQYLKECLLSLGEPCKTILEQFYFFKTSMKKIAEMLNYTNANNAKNQKYKCFIRLKKMVLAASNN